LPKAAHSFVRDRFTWLAYAMLAYFSYMQAILGPLTPFLRDALNLSYTVAGMHLSALAVGAALGGMAAGRVFERWGRHATFWGGGAGMSLGGLLLATAISPVITITGTFLIGLCGVLVMIIGQAGLSDHHGGGRAVALAEGSLASSLLASFAPLLVGGFERAGIGWRGAVISLVAAWGAILIGAWRVPIPAGNPSSYRACREKTSAFSGVLGNPGKSSAAWQAEPVARAKLPLTFWAYWVLLMMLVAVHWSMGLWSAEYFQSVVGLDKPTASTLAWAFLSAVVIGRLMGMRLIRHLAPRWLLLISIALALVGFPVFWRASVVTLNVIGLFVMGLGVANFYSLGLSLAIGTAPEIADAASARVSVGVGLAMLVVPQTLGWTADQIGLRAAFGIVAVVLVLALLMVSGIVVGLRREP
jgi:MFS family permease